MNDVYSNINPIMCSNNYSAFTAPELINVKNKQEVLLANPFKAEIFSLGIFLFWFFISDEIAQDHSKLIEIIREGDD